MHAADGEHQGVVTDISPRDVMYAGNLTAYLRSGRRALECIQSAISLLPSDRQRAPSRILDLPCGHGRVLRHLRKAWPAAELTACDIDRDGVDFCAATFGARPAYSQHDPERIGLDGDFDLIWCGSLLTHLDADMCARFLEAFASLLAADGLLVFTTHGRKVADMLRGGVKTLGLDAASARLCVDAYDAQGFGYQDFPNAHGYGISLAKPSWVRSLVERRPGWTLISYAEQGWASAQDVIACVNSPLGGASLPKLGEVGSGDGP